jgi:hypothetical protein
MACKLDKEDLAAIFYITNLIILVSLIITIHNPDFFSKSTQKKALGIQKFSEILGNSLILNSILKFP